MIILIVFGEGKSSLMVILVDGLVSSGQWVLVIDVDLW